MGFWPFAHGAELHAKDWKGRTALDLAQTGDSLTEMIRKDTSLRHAERVKALKILRDRKGSKA